MSRVSNFLREKVFNCQKECFLRTVCFGLIPLSCVVHPNLKLINAFFIVYGSNDIDTMKKIFLPTVEWVIPGRHRLSGTKTGVEEVLNYFKELTNFSFKAEPIVMGVNDEYVIDCHLNWSNLKGVKNIKAMSCLLWKFKDGKIDKVYNFPEDQHMIDTFFNNA